MVLIRPSLMLAILFTSSILPHDFSKTFETSSQKPHQCKIKDKIQDEKSKLKIDCALVFSGLALFYLGTRNKTEPLTDTQLFTHLAGTVLTGVGALLGVNSLQELFILNKKLKQQTNSSPESKAAHDK